MADTVYNSFKKDVMDGTISMSSDTLRVGLLDSAYTIDKDAHEEWSDVNGNEVSGTGYSSGGKKLSNKSFSIDDSDDEGVFDASDVTWGSSTIDAQYAVVYRSTSQTTTSSLVAVFDFGGEKSSSNGDFTVSWNSEGVLNAN